MLHARQVSRRGHRPAARERVEQVYILLIGVLVLGAMLVAGGESLLQGDGCVGGTCLQPDGRPALAGAVAMAGWGVLWRSLLAVGPVGATRAEASWLLTTPADRTRLLLPAWLRAAAWSLLAGALLGWLTMTSLAGSSAGLPQVAGAIATGAMVGLGTASIAAIVQGAGLGLGRGARVPWLLTMLLAAGCAAQALARRGPVADRAGPVWAVATPTILAVLVTLTVAAMACLWVAVRALRRLALMDLTAAGDAQTGLQGAVLLLDGSHARSTFRRTSRRAGLVRSRAGASAGAWALLHRHLLLLLRRPALFLVAAGLLLVPALVQLLAGPALALVVAVLVGVQVARSTAGALQVVTGSGGLARSLPFTALALTGLLIVVPGVALLGWAGVLVLLLDLPSWAAVSVTAAVVAALVRSARPADLSSTGALLMTEAGPVPVGLVARLVRGPDVALLAISPLLLQLGPVVALFLPLLLLAAVLRQETRTQ